LSEFASVSRIKNWAFLAGIATAELAVAQRLPANAAEYCVTCAAPAAMYACTIDGVPPEAPNDPRGQLLCIQELARLGNHETCSVPRSAPQPCPGMVRVVAAPADGTPPAAAATDPAAAGTEPALRAEGAPTVVTAPPPGDAPPLEKVKPAKEPRTVEELAIQTVDASKQGLKKASDAVTGTAEKAGENVGKAGSAVGDAAKKTWHCLSSLFSDC